MSIPTKYHLWVATLFSVYFVLVVFALDPFVFLENHNPWLTYPLIFGTSFLTGFGLLKLVGGFFKRLPQHLAIICGIFIISLVCGGLIFFLNDSTNVDLILYYNTFLIAPILPTSVYVLWLMYFDLSKRVIVSTESKETEEQSVQKLFRITNSKNEVVLECPIENIIAFEANDNYVNTYHLGEGDSVSRMMHRISLKKITELLAQINIEFHRVHKSYLINPEFVHQLKGKSQSYRIVMTHLPIEVPVSRTFDIKLIQTKKN